MRTARDEPTVWSENPRSNEWKGKGHVAGAKLKLGIVWFRCEAGDELLKEVVDVKVKSTEDMNNAFKEKDEKFREWAIRDTREKKVVKAVMVSLIISHDGAVHKDTVRRSNDFGPDIPVDWVWMAQNVLQFNVVIVGRFCNKGSWVSEAWRKEHCDE